ncbi:MAG: ABC transporter ATP-binding protein [Gemmatimonadota bacterium]|nr:ABC transporter ATP-binding protein [Gemmatimonadota bacterium]
MPRTAEIVRQTLYQRKYTVIAVILMMLAGSAVMLVQPLFYKMLFDRVIPESDTGLLWWLLAGMVATPLVSIGISYFEGHLRVRIGYTVTQALHKAVLNHLLHARLDAVEKIPTGSMVYRVTRDAGKIGDMYIKQELLPVVSSAIVLAGVLVMMFLLNAELAAVFCAALPATYLVTRYLTRYSKEMDREVNDQGKASESFLYEVFNAFRTIRMFNGEGHARMRWAGHMDRFTRIKIRGAALHDIMLTFPNEVINGLVLGVLLGYGAFQVMDGTVTIGSLVAIMAYAPRAYAALRTVLTTYTGTRLIKVSVESLNELFDLPLEPGLRGNLSRQPTEVDPQPAVAEPPAGAEPPAIEFAHVDFSYDRGYELKDLSFRVNGGEFVGIVGPSGGGKTTIIDLLTRLQEPESGRIVVAGRNIREMSLESLRNQIAVVSQDVFIWNATLAENIAYPDMDYRPEAVDQAVRASALEEFIDGQQEGLETVAGEGGIALSGGERQRIALARAFMRDGSRILILDEATSALDALAEEKIRTAVEEARIGRTTIAIAHRLSTIRHADRILVIDGGKMVESGTPRELVERGGIFARMYDAQALEFE